MKEVITSSVMAISASFTTRLNNILNLLSMAILQISIANTHEDYEICIETHVELDEKKRFVITLDEYDFSYPRFNGNNELICSTKAYINFDDVFEIASKLKIHVVELPDYFCKRFGINRDGEYEEVVDIFRNMLNFVLSNGVHYTLKKYEQND